MAGAPVGSVSVDVVPNVERFNSRMREKLLPQADRIGDEVGRRIGDRIEARLRDKLANLPDARVGIGANAAEFDAKYREVEAKATRLGRRTETIKVKADTRDVDSALQRVDRAIDRFSAPALSKVSGIALGAAALAPSLEGVAAAAPLLGAVAGSLTAAGVETGAFAVVAKASYKDLESRSKTFHKAQTDLTQAQAKLNAADTDAEKLAARKQIQKALTERADATRDLTGAQKLALQQYDDFQTASDNFMRRGEQAAAPAVGGALQLLTEQLPKALPFIQGASKAFSDLERDASHALDSKFWTNFEDFINRRGPDSIRTYGRVAGNVVTGIFGTIQGFDPQIQATEHGLLSLSRKFAHFGQDAAAGKSKPFKAFVDFSTDIAPDVKRDLQDIGKFAGDLLSGLAPSAKPSLDLVDDVINTVGPLLHPLEEKLPGIIGHIDDMVTKLGPLADKLSGPFSEGVATAVSDIADGIGAIAGWLDQIPEPILSSIGKDIGIIVAAATLAKLTGLSKFVGLLGSLYSVLANRKRGRAGKDPLDDTADKFGNLGKKARGAGTDLDSFSRAKGREKDVMGGNAELLGANSRAFEELGDQAATAGRKIGISAGTASKFALGAGAIGLPGVQGVDIIAHDKTKQGVEDARRSLANVGDRNVYISASDETYTGVKGANRSLSFFQPKTVDLTADNFAGVGVKGANRDISFFHGKNVPLSVSGLTQVRSTRQSAQREVDRWHGKTASIVLAGLGAIRRVEHTAQDVVSTFHGKTANLILGGLPGIRGVVHLAQSIVSSFHSPPPVQLRADSSGIGASVASAQSKINSLHGKTVTIQTNYVEHHSGGGKSNLGTYKNPYALQRVGPNHRDSSVPNVPRIPSSRGYSPQLPDAGGLSSAYGRGYGALYPSGGGGGGGRARSPVSGRAGGAKITGPGTGTSDSIPAMVSNGEWVINARRSAELGDAFLAWVNYGAGRTPPGYWPMYADGGRVQSRAALIQQEKLRRAEIQRANAEAHTRRIRLRHIGEGLVSVILDGISGSSSASRISATADRVISHVTDDFTGRRQSALVGFVKQENRDLQGLARDRDRITARLNQYREVKATAAGAARDFGSLGSLGQTTSAVDITHGLRARLSTIRTFNANLRTLAHRGLAQRALDQIIGLGPEQGALIAAQLVRGGNIRSVNRLTAQIDTAANRFGVLAAREQVGGNLARDFVTGLSRQRGRIEAEMRQAARAFSRQINVDFRRQAARVQPHISHKTEHRGHAGTAGAVTPAAMQAAVTAGVAQGLSGAELALAKRSGKTVAQIVADEQARNAGRH